MKSLTIQYWELGRKKAKGEFKTTFRNQNRDMLKEFKKHLISQDISFKKGYIYAGFRLVGYYRVIK